MVSVIKFQTRVRNISVDSGFNMPIWPEGFLVSVVMCMKPLVQLSHCVSDGGRRCWALNTGRVVFSDNAEIDSPRKLILTS